MTPSCCIRSSLSHCSNCSAIFPSARRQMLMPLNRKRFPVGGMPAQELPLLRPLGHPARRDPEPPTVLDDSIEAQVSDFAGLWGSKTLIGRVAGCPTWLILRTHRLRAEIHRCPPPRCGAPTNTTP